MYSQIDANKRKSLLLTIFFIVFVLFLGFFIGKVNGFGFGGLIIAGVISFFMNLTAYFKGDKIALMSAGAKGPISKEQNSYVYRLVENLSITAGITMPKVYIIPDSGMNAFATGRDPEHASVAITQGLIDNLENEELEGVIAHELSHIKNYDIRLMTIVIVLVGVVSLLADWLWRGSFFRKSDNEKGSGIFMIVGIILIVLSPIFAKLIQLAVSRKREYLADASGALLTRYPLGLAKALEKISTHSVLQKTNKATAHLYIANPFKNNKFSNLFSTHPPIEKRIKALKDMISES